MIEPRRDREDIARGLLEDLFRRPAVLGRVLHQPVFEHLPEISLPSILFGQALGPSHQELRRLACEIEHEFWRHLEAVLRLLARTGSWLFITPHGGV